MRYPSAETDLDEVYDPSKTPESDTRKVPFPLFCWSEVSKKHSKYEIRQAFGHMVSIKLPMATLYASQERVSPIGVEKFVILAMAGILVPEPVVIHFEGRHIIHEGHHRLTALHDLGSDVVNVQLVDLGGSLWAPDEG